MAGVPWPRLDLLRQPANSALCSPSRSAHHAPGLGPCVLAVRKDRHAVHEDVDHSGGVLVRLVERSVVRYGRRVEDHDASGGLGHLWKIVRSFDDPATWTEPGVRHLAANGPGGPVHRVDALPDQWELYDLDADPVEADNRANDADAASVLAFGAEIEKTGGHAWKQRSADGDVDDGQYGGSDPG